MTIYAKLWPIIANWFKAPKRQTTRTVAVETEPQLVAGVSPAYQLAKTTKVYAYAGTRTRLKAQQTSFIGAASKKVKVPSPYY